MVRMNFRVGSSNLSRGAKDKMTNRFLLALQMRYGDELHWEAKIDGELCTCIWRNWVSYPERNDIMTFLALTKNGKVKQVYSLYVGRVLKWKPKTHKGV